MSETPAQILSALRDVGGVQGSFLLQDDGSLVARDLGALLNEELLTEIAPRLLRLCDTFGGDTAPVTSCSLRFADLLLFMRPTPGGLVCAVSTLDVNMPALKMAVNLTARRLAPHFAPAARLR